MEHYRERANKRLARAYYKLLTSIDWSDQVLVSGLREGLNKFLSNAHIAAFPGKNKYYKTHYVSPPALDQLRDRNIKGLVWEHLVPKTQYIQSSCENLAREGRLTIEFIEERLQKYWFLATITASEDAMLPRFDMPPGWDQVDVQARYNHAGIVLQPNPYFLDLQHAATPSEVAAPEETD